MKRRADAIRRVDGGLADAEIERVCEQRVKLNARDKTLRQERPVLLDNREQMRDIIMPRDDRRLTEECAAFRPADIEGIAQGGEIWERHVVFRTGQRIGEARPVKIQREVVFPANAADFRELCQRIQRSEFRGV